MLAAGQPRTENVSQPRAENAGRASAIPCRASAIPCRASATPCRASATPCPGGRVCTVFHEVRIGGPRADNAGSTRP